MHHLLCSKLTPHRVITGLVRQLSVCSKSLWPIEEAGDMSYRHGGGAGGFSDGRRRGGPNRGGGRGRGGRGRGGGRDRGGGSPSRGGGRGGGGGGRGRGGGPPPGLSGREIGMFYARKSQQKKVEVEKNSRAVVSIDRAAERNITQILSDVKDHTSQNSLAEPHRAASWSSQQNSYTHGQPDRAASWAANMQDQGPYAQPDRSSSWLSEMKEGTSQNSLASDSDWCTLPEEPGTIASENVDWYIDSSGADMSDTGEGLPSSGGGGGGPPGFEGPPGVQGPPGSGGCYLPPQQQVGAGSQPSLVGGAPCAEATPAQSRVETENDRKLRDELLEARRTNNRYKKMLGFREQLPSWKAREEVLQLIKSSQVCVISGETGCGKTTQVPQFILDDAILNGWGSKCNIICTQPRRISAISVAQRVAAERGETLGNSAGFQIRLENTLPRNHGSVVYCTTGILLRRLIGDPVLSQVSHVIMDEVHERNINSDFLTIIMRDLLLRRPDLKLILMSATINAELFSGYFNNAPMYTIKNVTYPVTTYFLEDILKMTKYRLESGGRQSKPRPHWSRYGQGRKDFEKAEEEQAEKNKYLDTLEQSRCFPYSVIESLRSFDEKELDLNLVMEIIRYICTSMGDGAILIFLPGWDTITKLNDLLMASPVYRSQSKYLVIPLHSMMPTAFQQKVFDRPPPGVRKIVIATNIAETSITIDDVVFVIDCGKVKETTYDAANQMACLDAVWVSKAAARQRKGRAGRVQAGHCFHVFSKFRHDRMAEFQLPEMLRTPLEELVLQIKILQLGYALPFLQKAIEPPKERAVNNAIRCLTDLRALTGNEELTPLGHHLANLPVNPRIGKIILFGAMFSCLDPVLTIASALGFKEPFVIPLHKQEEADAIKREFAGDSRSDHIALLMAFQGWEKAKRHGEARQYCWDNFLANNTLELLMNMKKQFAGLLYDTGFISSAYPREESANINSWNIKLVKAVLCAGLYPNVVKIVQNKPGSHPKLFTKDGKVKFHPKSVNCEETFFDSKYMIYHTKVKSSAVFVHDASLISPLPLLFFGGDIAVGKDGSQDTIAVDDWIVFQASPQIAELVKKMRQQLDLVLQQKVAQPRLELYNPRAQNPSPTSQLTQAIIDLITQEDYSQQAARLASGKHLYARGQR